MVVLRKVKASTLMETLVASVLIVVVFMVSSAILNNMYYNTVNNRTHSIKNYLSELEYNYRNEQIKLPYKERFENWDVMVERFLEKNHFVIEFEATHINTKKVINKEYVETK